MVKLNAFTEYYYVLNYLQGFFSANSNLYSSGTS